MFEDLDEGAAYDANGVKMDQGVIIKFIRSEGDCPDNCQELINFFSDDYCFCLVPLTEDLHSIREFLILLWSYPDFVIPFFFFYSRVISHTGNGIWNGRGCIPVVGFD